METYAWVIAGVALGLVSPFLALHLRRNRDFARAAAAGRPASREYVRPANPYAAVSIRPCLEEPCAAVVQMQDKRFLAVRAPTLPVPGCDRKQCGCQYVRHADRRKPGDRRDVFARFGGLTPTVGKERRGGDRRKGSAH